MSSTGSPSDEQAAHAAPTPEAAPTTGSVSAEPTELLALACSLARTAGSMAAEGRRRGTPANDTKSTATDMVTEFDRASEQLIVSGLRAARPFDGLIGEEGSSIEGTSGIDWVDRSHRRHHQLPVRPAGLGRVDRRRRRRRCARRRGVRARLRRDVRRQPRRWRDLQRSNDLVRNGRRSRDCAAGHRIQLLTRPPSPARRPGSSTFCRRSATSDAWVPPRSTSAMSPVAASMPTSRSTSGHGTSPPVS